MVDAFRCPGKETSSQILLGLGGFDRFWREISVRDGTGITERYRCGVALAAIAVADLPVDSIRR
jgi:hypothetical protein